MMKSNCHRVLSLLTAIVGVAVATPAERSIADELEVGFKAVDVTPELASDKPIWLAGLERNRAAAEVHDRLFARAAVLRAGGKSIALVAVDSIGIQRPTVEAVRRRLNDLDYVLVASTHTHSGPDCIGLWGPTESESGVTPDYMKQVEEGIVRAVEGAAEAAEPARASYGTAEDKSLLADYRLPEVFDSVLRTIRFDRIRDGKPCGLLVQWNSHGVEPRNNMRISRDFMGATVDELERRHECPVVYFSGAIGGLMGTPDKTFLDENEQPIRDPFEFMEAYGSAVADLVEVALEEAQPIELTPLVVSSKPVAIPLDNQGYRMARAVGVLERPIIEWTGEPESPGVAVPRERIDGDLALESEVAYLRLGALHVAAIPGELYPELVYGEFQEPADPGADFADAPLEKPVMRSLPGDKTLLIGLANDEIGYIVPKRQWDEKPPYCYGRDSPQYGEVNSVGPEAAAIIANALSERVREATAR